MKKRDQPMPREIHTSNDNNNNYTIIHVHVHVSYLFTIVRYFSLKPHPPGHPLQQLYTLEGEYQQNQMYCSEIIH